MSRISPVLVSAIVLATSSLARSAPPPVSARARVQARVHFDRAEAAKARRDYDAAATEYLAAYDQYPQPELIYDAAEMARLADHKQQALDYFQRYLALDGDGRGAAAARASIEALTAAITAERDAARRDSAPPATPPPLMPPPTADHAAGIASTPAPSESRDAAEADHGRTQRLAGLATGGAGVLAIGAGVLFGFHARHLASQANHATVYDPDLDARGDAANRNMWIAYGVGGLALTGGAILYYLGSHADRADEPRVTIVPALAPSSLAITASGRF